MCIEKDQRSFVVFSLFSAALVFASPMSTLTPFDDVIFNLLSNYTMKFRYHLGQWVMRHWNLDRGRTDLISHALTVKVIKEQ